MECSAEVSGVREGTYSLCDFLMALRTVSKCSEKAAATTRCAGDCQNTSLMMRRCSGVQ